jgi:septum formation protein
MTKALVILASSSPFRRALLLAAGVTFDAVAPPIDEQAAKIKILQRQPDILPPDLALELATVKGLSVSALSQDMWVIGADQVLALDRKMFSKPVGRNQAHAQLMELSGKTHRLYSAVTLSHNGAVVWSTVATAQLHMRVLGPGEVEHYLDRCGPEIYQSVGAYQIEGLGSQLFETIEGDYFTIIGLPLLQLLGALRVRGLLQV